MGGCCSCGRKPKAFARAKQAYDRYLKDKHRDDLTDALTLFQTALEECRASPDKKELSAVLIKYASALYAQYSDFDKPAEDLAKVIELEEEAFRHLENIPGLDALAPEYEALLHNLGDAYLSQYEDFGNEDSFDKAIGKYKALQLRDKASPKLRRQGVLIMADVLVTWSDEHEGNERGERKEKVDQAIDVLMTAKRKLGKGPSPSEDPDELKTFRQKCLVHLALAHHSRYKIEKGSGKVDNAIPDLDQAIKYNREARAMLLVGQGLELIYCLSNLARQLYDKYEYLDRPEEHEVAQVDLDEALEGVKKVVEERDSAIDTELAKRKDKEEELKEIKKELKDFLDKVKNSSADTHRPST